MITKTLLVTALLTGAARPALARTDLDTSLGGRSAFVVTHEDGVPLASTQGPYRAVILGDARAARWVRRLERLEVVEVP